MAGKSSEGRFFRVSVTILGRGSQEINQKIKFLGWQEIPRSHDFCNLRSNLTQFKLNTILSTMNIWRGEQDRKIGQFYDFFNDLNNIGHTPSAILIWRIFGSPPLTTLVRIKFTRNETIIENRNETIIFKILPGYDCPNYQTQSPQMQIKPGVQPLPVKRIIHLSIIKFYNRLVLGRSQKYHKRKYEMCRTWSSACLSSLRRFWKRSLNTNRMATYKRKGGEKGVANSRWEIQFQLLHKQ